MQSAKDSDDNGDKVLLALAEGEGNLAKIIILTRLSHFVPSISAESCRKLLANNGPLKGYEWLILHYDEREVSQSLDKHSDIREQGFKF